MKTGIELIAQERKKQIKKHGFDLEHDQIHDDGALIDAALVCASYEILYTKHKYAGAIHFDIVDKSNWKLPVYYDGNVLVPNHKLSDEKRIHQLTVAGALMAAEIDRIQNNL